MKKLIFLILSSVFILIIPNVVNAETVSSFFSSQSASNVTGEVNFSVGDRFTNFGFGYVNTNINIKFQQRGYIGSNNFIDLPSIRQALGSFGGGRTVCDIGSVVVAADSPNTQDLYQYVNVSYSVSCPVDLSNSSFSGIYLYFQLSSAWSISEVTIGPWWTFVSSSQSEVANAIQNNTNAINNVNDSINNDNVSTNNENSSTASSWASQSASDSVVSDMVLMPITLLNAFSSGFSGSCQAYNLGSLYGTNLTLPCINIQNYLGATLWGIIDVLMSGFLIYGIGKKFVRVFNDFTNLKDSQVDELYGGGNE